MKKLFLFGIVLLVLVSHSYAGNTQFELMINQSYADEYLTVFQLAGGGAGKCVFNQTFTVDNTFLLSRANLTWQLDDPSAPDGSCWLRLYDNTTGTNLVNSTIQLCSALSTNSSWGFNSYTLNANSMYKFCFYHNITVRNVYHKVSYYGVDRYLSGQLIGGGAPAIVDMTFAIYGDNRTAGESSTISNITFNSNNTNISGAIYGNTAWFSINVSVSPNAYNLSHIWLSIQNSSGWHNRTKFSIYGNTSYLYNTTYTLDMAQGQLFNWTFWANDTSGNASNSSKFSYALTNTAPNAPSNLAWITTGGFTSGARTYNQIIDNVTATCQTSDGDGDTVTCNITVTKPDLSIAVNNQPMLNLSTLFYYSTDWALNQAGDWNITITASDGIATNTSSTIINVETQNLTTIDGWFGYTNGTISSDSEILFASTYGATLIEFNSSIQTISSNWVNLLNATNKSKSYNLHVGLNFVVDYNFTNTTKTLNAVNNITANFGDLKTDPYSITIEYISLEPINPLLYTDADVYNTLNNISISIVDATDNNFIIYSKNYSSSGLDASYILNTTMMYVDEISANNLVAKERTLMRTKTSLNRIYRLTSTLMQQAQGFWNNIIDILRGKPFVTSIVNISVAQLDNDDIVVFNNESTEQDIEVNVSLITGALNKDVWDFTKKWLIEANTDLKFNVNISGNSSNAIYFDDLDTIRMDTGTSATLFKATSSGKLNFSWGNNTNGDNFALDNDADEFRIELFDPHYILSNFIVYYGWFNASYTSNWSSYNIVIFDDESPSEFNKVFANTSTTEFYCYGSVADYQNTGAWTNGKKTEVDSCLALNSSTTRLNFFWDGLDNATFGTNFSVKMKELVDYVKIDKGRRVILNTYTAYADFCTWVQPTGYCMRESCVRRWNGASSASPTSYTWEDWNLEINKSAWYKSHNVPILCQAFDNRTADTFEPENWTTVQNAYYGALVLGYTNFYISQPDFNYAHTIYLKDVGTDMAQSYSTTDNETYSRRYSEGIVYYNSSSHIGYIDDGRETEVQACFTLYDNSDGAGDEERDFEFRINNISTTDINQYIIPATTITAGVWVEYCVKLNETHESATGNYQIEGSTTNSGQVADAIFIGNQYYSLSGKHSWWSTNAGDPVWNVYDVNKNWQVKIIVNETKKASIDSFSGKITQSNASSTTQTNLTLTSVKSYNLEVWSNTLLIANFKNLSFWNGTINKAVGIINTTTCDSNNPTWNSTTIDGEVHKACIKPSGANTLVRVATPHLSTVTYTIENEDVIAPIINSLSPSDGFNTTNISRIFYFNATDDYPNKAELWGNWSGTWKVNQTISWVSNPLTNFSLINLTDGIYKWGVSVNDTSGYRNTSANRTISIDTTAPTIIESNTSSNSFYFGSTVTMNATATDAIAGVNTVILSHNFTGSWVNLTLNSPYSYTASAGNFTANTHFNWRIYANDSLGNFRTGNLQSFYILSPPEEGAASAGGVSSGMGQQTEQAIEQTSDCGVGQQLYNGKCHNCTGQLIQIGKDIYCRQCSSGFTYTNGECRIAAKTFSTQVNWLDNLLYKIPINPFVSFLLLIILLLILLSILLDYHQVYRFGYFKNRPRRHK